MYSLLPSRTRCYFTIRQDRLQWERGIAEVIAETPERLEVSLSSHVCATRLCSRLWSGSLGSPSKLSDWIWMDAVAPSRRERVDGNVAGWRAIDQRNRNAIARGPLCRAKGKGLARRTRVCYNVCYSPGISFCVPSLGDE